MGEENPKYAAGQLGGSANSGLRQDGKWPNENCFDSIYPSAQASKTTPGTFLGKASLRYVVPDPVSVLFSSLGGAKTFLEYSAVGANYSAPTYIPVRNLTAAFREDILRPDL